MFNLAVQGCVLLCSKPLSTCKIYHEVKTWRDCCELLQVAETCGCLLILSSLLQKKFSNIVSNHQLYCQLAIDCLKGEMQKVQV